MTNQWLGGIVAGVLFGASLGACFGFVPLISVGGGVAWLVISFFMLGLGIVGMVSGGFLGYTNHWETLATHRWVRVHVTFVAPAAIGAQLWIIRRVVLFTADATMVAFIALAASAILILPYVITAIRLARSTARYNSATKGIPVE
jgi:hypothetical protein